MPPNIPKSCDPDPFSTFPKFSYKLLLIRNDVKDQCKEFPNLQTYLNPRGKFP
jgi:hypothetical protein